jgi:hypothetical protein
VLVLDGKENTRLLIDPYYNANYKLYGSEVFDPQDLMLFDSTNTGKFIDIQQVVCNRMVMPLTGQEIPVQLWNAGKMVYGNSNPESNQCNSLADFCAGSNFVEIRIPWMLLNFADPSSGKILGNLHLNGNITFEKISSLYAGLDRADTSESIAMTAYQLPQWVPSRTVSVSSRLIIC